MVNKILVANPRGFCAGVERAINIVDKCLEIYGKPVYVRHHIVHNTHVVKSFEDKGVIFVEDIDEIPDGSVCVLSAHGTSKEVLDEANQRDLKVIDAVCPLVTKIHFEAKMFNEKGYEIVYIGHRGHQEAVGSMSYAKMHLVDNISDVEKMEIDSNKKLIYLTQTTLSIDDTQKIVLKLKEKFPYIESPPKDDICYATTNRQVAVKDLAKICDFIYVVGSKTSSNSKRLVETAIKSGCGSKLIDTIEDLDEDVINNCKLIGISSGASVPENITQEVILEIKKISGNDLLVEDIYSVDEKMFFAMPKELK